jgi:hypothetical protein
MDELEGSGEAPFEILFCNLPGWTEENHKKHQSG